MLDSINKKLFLHNFAGKIVYCQKRLHKNLIFFRNLLFVRCVLIIGVIRFCAILRLQVPDEGKMQRQWPDEPAG